MRGNGSPPKRKKQHVGVELPLPAISTNKLYMGIKKRSGYYKTFRKKVLQYLATNYDASLVSLTGNLCMTLEVGFSSSLSDLSNAIKGIEDVLCEFYGFNDRQIVHIEMDKKLVDKGCEYMSIHIKKSRKRVDYKTSKKNVRKCKRKGNF